MRIPSLTELEVATLGPCRHASPLARVERRFADERRRVLVCSDTDEARAAAAGGAPPPTFEAAGPRERLFFAPGGIACGLVTCGGLCPGLNDVIRAIVLMLAHGYGVQRILGFRYGYLGLSSQAPCAPLLLTLETVSRIHEDGGSILGSSRGPHDLADMVATLRRENIGILFAIGGDGTLRGASALAGEIRRQGVPIAVIGVPKSIDNDVLWVERSFGFASAVAEASRVLAAAHCEARGAWRGVGLVKLMGRHSGFIAAHAALANSDVNFCLVPEVPLRVDGEDGFLAALERRLAARQHAVIAVAEGAGQDLLDVPDERDASGNRKLGDIGAFLRERIAAHFAARGEPVAMRYIDPSYVIRGRPANTADSEFCLILGQHAVHAGMAGRTDMMVGYWSRHFTHVPIAPAVAERRCLDPRGGTWQRVLASTGQPAVWRRQP
jgi:6-phosphofructokinase 1